MRNKSPLLFYIVINIFISAVTTLTVLWIWDSRQPELNPLEFETQQTISNPVTPSDQVIPDEDENPTTQELTSELSSRSSDVQIRVIVGPGNLEVEYVEIINQGEKPVDLTGWQLVNHRDQIFTIPAMILNSSGAIKIQSKSGVNSVIELFWQSDSPIWESGENARLINDDGEIVSTYSIP